MIFEQLLERARTGEPRRLAAVMPDDQSLLAALCEARRLNVASATLIGNRCATEAVAQRAQLDLSDFAFIEVPDAEQATSTAVDLVCSDQADAIAKGNITTGGILRGLLSSKKFARGATLSHIAVFEVERVGHPFLLSDSGMIVQPTFEELLAVVHNAVEFARTIGLSPRVAILSTVESVSVKIPSTVVARRLRDTLRSADPSLPVEGPLSLDLAISPRAVAKKRFEGEVAGRATILIVPDIVSGNLLGKSLVYCAGAQAGGIVVGGRVPVVLLSRADTPETKLNSITLSVASMPPSVS